MVGDEKSFYFFSLLSFIKFAQKVIAKEKKVYFIMLNNSKICINEQNIHTITSIKTASQLFLHLNSTFPCNLVLLSPVEFPIQSTKSNTMRYTRSNSPRGCKLITNDARARHLHSNSGQHDRFVQEWEQGRKSTKSRRQLVSEQKHVKIIPATSEMVGGCI